jgi:hypothetical protein
MSAYGYTPILVIVNDDAEVIRVSELRAMYAEAGDFKTLGKALGLSAATLCRALRTEQTASTEEERIARVKAMLPSAAAPEADE